MSFKIVPRHNVISRHFKKIYFHTIPIDVKKRAVRAVCPIRQQGRLSSSLTRLTQMESI